MADDDLEAIRAKRKASQLPLLPLDQMLDQEALAKWNTLALTKPCRWMKDVEEKLIYFSKRGYGKIGVKSLDYIIQHKLHNKGDCYRLEKCHISLLILIDK